MIKKELFGTYNNTKIYKYTIEGEITVSVITLGARVFNIFVPDKNGNKINVALDHDTPEYYIESGGCLGATIGRHAGRISGTFRLNGEKYQLTYAPMGVHRHGGKMGFDKKVFDARIENDSVIMGYFSPDGEEGYPSSLKLFVKFSVAGKTLSIEYFAQSVGDTVLNVTNHTYFNLNGAGKENVADHLLRLKSDRYLAIKDNMMPTGELKSVKDTPFDFTEYKAIGKDIDADDTDLRIAGGYDHTYAIDGGLFAEVYSPSTGIKMEASTDMPGVHFYTGGHLRPSNDRPDYGKLSGFCLETQFYPDAINHPEWKSSVLKKGEKFYSKTEFSFSVEK